MKKFHKFISIILCLTLLLAFSTSFVFATATQWDTSDQTNLKNAQSYLYNIWNWVNNYAPTFNGQSLINQNLSSINNKLGGFTSSVTLYDALSSIDNHLDAIESGIVGSSGTGIANILSSILAEFTSTSAVGAVTHFFREIYANVFNINSLVNTIRQQVANNLPSINSGINDNLPGIYAYSGDIASYTRTIKDLLNNQYSISRITLGSNGSYTSVDSSASNFIQGLYWYLRDNNFALAALHNNIYSGIYQNAKSTQTALNWLTFGNKFFTPTSTADGIYQWLSNIQNPLARIAYIYANDQEIAARSAAAANQTAVVDNFIDSSGSGALPASSIGSVSNMSDSFKDNFSTDASPTGLFDIFNSDHGSWFSQETVDQLDTTNISNRSLKAAPSENFDTPLLDQQIDEIYNALGVKK